MKILLKKKQKTGASDDRRLRTSAPGIMCANLSHVGINVDEVFLHLLNWGRSCTSYVVIQATKSFNLTLGEYWAVLSFQSYLRPCRMTGPALRIVLQLFRLN